VADFGNQVCSAFDSGESYSQVKAAGLAQVAGNPFVTVTSADADWMIRTAVSMYCPGYASKLP
jgi:methenyltetrahydromethanopterin cyclohydrolase